MIHPTHTPTPPPPLSRNIFRTTLYVLRILLLALDYLLLTTPLVTLYTQHYLQLYPGYTLQFKLGGIRITTPAHTYTIQPHGLSWARADGQWCFTADDLHLGQLTLYDRTNQLKLECRNLNLGSCAGTLTLQLYPSTLHFSGKVNNTTVNLRAHSRQTYECALTEDSPSSAFDSMILSSPTNYECTLRCKRANPGITDLKILITTDHKTQQSKPWVTLSGKFYNIKFRGTGTGRLERGRVNVENTLIEPICVAWEDGIFYLTSARGLQGTANVLRQEFTLHYLDHTLSFAHNALDIKGPSIEGCLQNTPHFTVHASRFLYSGDLVGAVMWTESFNKHRAPGYSTIRCNNFQAPDGYMVVNGTPTELTAHIHQNGKNIYVQRNADKLLAACDDLSQFQPLLAGFVLKAGDCRIEAMHTDDRWTGSILVWNAVLHNNYHIPLTSNNWEITGKWSYRTHLRINVILDNPRHRVRVRGWIKDTNLALEVRTVKKNLPVRLLCLLGAEPILRLLESRFFVNGTTGKTRTTIDITNLFLGWVVLLPI